MKIQEKTCGNTTTKYVTLSKEAMDILRWNKGDIVMISVDKVSDSITVRRVK